ncbi:YppG family protein [Bacillus sp. cl95]|uniref:YppG family protein n=1 Tax=unclassified Bacillus (in: firmicutes) TaxID=185979 RepID=UPI0034A55A81
MFQNPLQPQDDLLHPYYQHHQKPVSNANPYPKQATMNKQGSSGKSILNSFKSQDGSVDLNKMMDTAGQMMNAVNQVSSLVKGLGSMFKA